MPNQSATRRQVLSWGGVGVASIALTACSKNSNTTAGSGGGASPTAGGGGGKGTKVALVLHLRIPFTQIILDGAQAAADQFAVPLVVTGPTNLDAPAEVSNFNNVLASGAMGIAVATNTPPLWVRPFQTAQSRGVPVVALNAGAVDMGPDSPPYVGVNEIHAGRALADLILTKLGPDPKGFVVIGNGQPGAPPLEDRAKGFGLQMQQKAPNVEIKGPYNVGQDPNANFNQWQNTIQANQGALAYVGITAVDCPNLAKIKQKADGKYVVAAFDEEPDTLAAVKSGVAAGSITQSPFMQGYIPVRLIIEQLKNNTPVPKNVWIDPGTEIVDSSNIEAVMGRQASQDAMFAFYKPKIDKLFANLKADEKPLAAQRVD
jgi:simple sugar transport system substrate-binding protein/ribose transport system substrate-binding protein